MKKQLKQFQLYILMIFFWIVLNGNADLATIISGTIFSVVIIKMTYHIMFELDDNILKLPPIWRFIWFGFIVLISIIKSSISHVIRILKNEQDYVTFDVHLDTKNAVIITLIANAITMTPGTITLDVEDNILKIVGFSRSEKDVRDMVNEILSYQKPFLYRRI
ncbi:hypothetical protein EZV73_07000 [Acidaminobacter sp. JC074]|uniref:Na+/H+ antiporter subunit E n=1 Tax=Acidaminobacter sp. JC074 TaxID=2530199 RepID=UPI001F0E6D6C|nr:Na+/H+ antiporter subunit E [Acidaminobacter sp. JC074]MCH4887312.1 hypothetical protein [Acidaminobacter sp. JC074]